MDIVKELEKLEDKFYGEWEEQRGPLVEALTSLHQEAGKDEDTFNRFLVQCSDRFGGVYIPYLFWHKLGHFLRVPQERHYLHQLVKTFVDSNFDDEEQKKMKLLLVTYFSQEKPFELDKLRAQIIDKSHPSVKEYFENLLIFVEKNAKATGMYAEKFKLLSNQHPDFATLSLPITQLRELYQEVN
ncbi:MAG: hypothetical protein AAFR61_15800 [Bacteroidota bacterium]